MKKVINKPEVALKRNKLIIHREIIALLSAVQLNRVASAVQLAAAASGSTDTMDIACDTTVSTQTQ